METKLTSIKENPLLDRKKVKVEINHEGESTPSEEDLKNRLVAENDLDEEKIDIKTINTKFGVQKSLATVNVYQEFEYDETLREETIKEEEETEITEEIEEVVSQTITEAKDELEDADEKTLKKALKAEKENKSRKTLTKWIRDRL